jgi:hypothetical protein
MPERNIGTCEHCKHAFGYRLIHSGFNESSYGYCDSCGQTAILNYCSPTWRKLITELGAGCPLQQEICLQIEPYLQACECGGKFKKGSSPRCPSCMKPLSAELAGAYIETNAAGTKKGWRWQRNWRETYGIIVEERFVEDNFKPL